MACADGDVGVESAGFIVVVVVVVVVGGGGGDSWNFQGLSCYHVLLIFFFTAIIDMLMTDLLSALNSCSPIGLPAQCIATSLFQSPQVSHGGSDNSNDNHSINVLTI